MEIGVTYSNPEITDLPSCAQKLTNGTWVKDSDFIYVRKLMPFHSHICLCRFGPAPISSKMANVYLKAMLVIWMF